MINASNYVCATTLENLVLAKGATGPVLDHSASLLAEIGAPLRHGCSDAVRAADNKIDSWEHRRFVVRRAGWLAASIGQLRCDRSTPFHRNPARTAGAPASRYGRPGDRREHRLCAEHPLFPKYLRHRKRRRHRELGMLPHDVVSSETAREAHFHITLGSFAPGGFPTPPFDFKDAAPFTDAVARQLQASAGRHAAETRDAAIGAGALQTRKTPSEPAVWTSGAVAARKRRPWIAPWLPCWLA